MLQISYLLVLLIAIAFTVIANKQGKEINMMFMGLMALTDFNIFHGLYALYSHQLFHHKIN
jgi:hypothetical protein